MVAYSLHIHGLVQGVFFRQSTLEKALELGVTGYVRNCDDGSVEVFAEGEIDLLKKFIEWCQRGPKRAKVEGIDINEQPLKNFRGFIITH